MRIQTLALRMSLLCLLTILSMSFSYDVTVNWNVVYQRIAGIGAGTDDSNDANPDVMELPEPARTQALDLLFDTTKGIGMSIVRLAVPFSLWPQGGTFNIAGWGNHAAMCLEAMKRGVNYFWGAPWTPPFWMKTVQTKADGSLDPAHYQDFADYLSHCVRDMKSQYNVEIKGISIQNEPNFNPSYGGCLYSPQQLDAFAKVLGATFDRDGVTAKIVLADVNLPDGFVPMCDAVINDANAIKYVGPCAFHVYNGSWPLASEFTNIHAKGKEVWETETSTDPWSGFGDTTMAQAVNFIRQLHDCMTIAKTSAWHYFEMCGQGNPPMRQVGSTFKATKLLYGIGNYSKFIRPGWYMIGIPFNTSDNVVSLSAYRDSVSGRFAIVAQNFSGSNTPGTITFTFTGFKATSVTPWLTDAGVNNLAKQTDIACVNGTSFTATIAPQSIVTYTGKNIAPSAALSAPNFTIPSSSGIKAVHGSKGAAIEIVVTRSGIAAISLIDRQGRTVRTVTREIAAAGHYSMDLDGCAGAGGTLSAGSYLCRVRMSDGRYQQAPVVIMGR